jgi:hypothetical protein
MARSLFTAAPTQATDAEFRAWGLAISTALAAVGLVKTADSGQIDWLTVLKPAGAGASQGYEIWRFNDALQATASVFLKIEYGSGTNLAYPSVWVTIGRGSDGAGTLTGLLTVRKQVNALASNAAPSACRVSGDTNRILVAAFVATANCPIAFGIERTHDAAGADTAEGVLFWTQSGASAWTQRYYSMSGGEGGIETNVGALVPATGTGSTGSAVAVYPVFCTKGVFCNPLRDVFIGFAANFTAGVQVAFTVYNASRLYMVLGTAITPNTGRVAIGLCLLIRDE